MKDSPIAPSIGRTVLVRTRDKVVMNGQSEMPAIVNAVHDNNCISVTALPYGAAPLPLRSIMYNQDPSAPGPDSATWRWMPYQLATAEKPA